MLRILVVDEDPSSRRQAADLLRHFDCAVRSVGDPNAALILVTHVRFDAVLISSSLPQMTATAFVEALGRARPTGEMSVIVMAVTPRAAIDAIRAGARGCVRKPIDVGGIVSALPPLLRHRAYRPRRGSSFHPRGASRAAAAPLAEEVRAGGSVPLARAAKAVLPTGASR